MKKNQLKRIIWICVAAAIMMTPLQLMASADSISENQPASIQTEVYSGGTSNSSGGSVSVVPASDNSSTDSGVKEASPSVTAENREAAVDTAGAEKIPEAMPSAAPAGVDDNEGVSAEQTAPAAEPSSSSIPEATPSGSVIPEVSPSGSIIPEASPSGSAIPSATPSSSEIPAEMTEDVAAEPTPDPAIKEEAAEVTTEVPVNESEEAPALFTLAGSEDSDAGISLAMVVDNTDVYVTNDSEDDINIDVEGKIQLSITKEGLLRIATVVVTAKMGTVGEELETTETTYTTYTASNRIKNILIKSKNNEVVLDKESAGTSLDVSNADVKLYGTSIRLESVKQVTLNVKSLLAQAEKEPTGEGKSFMGTLEDWAGDAVSPLSISNSEIIIENVDINAQDNVTLRARQYANRMASQTKEEALNKHSEDGSDIPETTLDGNTWSEMFKSYSLMLEADLADTIIKIKNSHITANEIEVIADNTAEMNTYGFFFAGNLAYTNTVVEVSNSILEAAQDIVLKANTMLKMMANRVPGIGAPFGLTTQILTGSTTAGVIGNSKLEAGGNIEVSADTILDTNTDQSAGRTDDAVNGGVVAFTITSYNTEAKIEDAAVLEAQNDIKIVSNTNDKSTTSAVVHSETKSEGVLGKNGELKMRGWEALNVLSYMFTGKTAVGAALTKPLEFITPAIEQIKKAFGKGGEVQGVELSSPNQYTGAFAVNYTNTKNNAFIHTSGTVTAGGDLTVLAKSSADAAVKADGATNATAQSMPKDGTLCAQMVCGTNAVGTEFGLVNAGALSAYLNLIRTDGGEVTFGEGLLMPLNVGHYWLTFTVDDSKYKVKGLDDPANGITKLYTTYAPSISTESGTVTTLTTYRKAIWLVPAEIAIEGTNVLLARGERIIIELEPAKAEPAQVIDDSKGIAVSVGITDTENKAYIDDSGKVTAKSVTVKAVDVTKEEKNDKGEVKESAVTNNSSVTAISGVSTGNVGLSGAIAVNYHSVDTEAYIDKTELQINEGAVNINAASTLGANVKATGKEKNKESGTGGSVGINWADYTTKAYLGQSAKLTGEISKLNITSNAKVKNSTVQLKSGIKSADGKGAAIAVNVLKTNTVAEIPVEADGGALSVNDLNVAAESVVAQNSITNNEISNGASGVGITLGLDWADLNTKAILSRTVEQANDISVTAAADISDEMDMRSTTAGAPKDPALEARDQQVEDDVNALIREMGLQDDPALAIEAPEGKVGVAGVAAIGLRTETVLAKVEGKTECAGELTVQATEINDIDITANGGATIQDNGYGVAVAVLDSTTKVDAMISGEHTAGSFVIAAEMPEDEEEESTDGADEGDSEEEDGPKSSVAVHSYAGAGAADVGVAGAVSRNRATADYTATVEGKLTATDEDGESRIAAKVLREVETQASGSADQNGLVHEDEDDDKPDTSKGIGAAFAWDRGGVSAQAIIKAGAVVTAAGDLDFNGEIKNENSTTAEAGGDVYEEPAYDGLIWLKFVDGNGKPVKARAFVWVYKDGEQIDFTDTRGAWLYQGKDITFTAQKDYFYTVRLFEADDSEYKFNTFSENITFKINDDNPGYTETFVLTKSGEEVFYNTAMDGSVAVNAVTNNAVARAEAGSTVKAANLNVSATSSSTTEVNGGSEAQSSNSAVGATLAVNVIEENVKAELLGNVVSETLKVCAAAATQDIAETAASAKGVDLERYERNFSEKISKWGEEKVKSKIPTKYLTNKGTANNDIMDAVRDVGDIGAGDARPVGEDAPLGQQLLGGLNVQADERNAANAQNLNGGNVNAGNAQAAVGNAGEADSEKTAITFAAAIGVNVVKHTTEATVAGAVTVTGDVEITATNDNDLKTLGDASSVAAKTALSTGVSVVVNNSSATAKADTTFADIDEEEEEEDTDSETGSGEEEESESETEDGEEEVKTKHIGSVKVSAETRVNMSKDFGDSIASQAIAGSGTGTAEGSKLAFAGAVAVVSSNAKTTAVWNVPEAVLESSGAIDVTATEQSKLGARAWAGALQSRFLNAEDKQLPGASGSGVGLACAWVKSNNETKASLLTANGGSVNIKASAVNVAAKKLRVDKSSYNYTGFDLNGVLVIGSGAASLDVKLNFTDEKQSADKLAWGDLIDVAKTEGLKLLNYVATRNYYIEAVGGTALVNTNNFNGLSGSGSFAIMDLKDIIESEIGDGFTITADTVKNDAESDADIVEIGGAVSYGGNTGAGVVINVVDNRNEVRSKVGEIKICSAKEVAFDSVNHIDVTGFSAAAVTPGFKDGDRAIAGTINIVNDKAVTETMVKLTSLNEEGDLAEKLHVAADHVLGVKVLAGNLSWAKDIGAGGSLVVTVSDANTKAIADGTGAMRVLNTEVTASGRDTNKQYNINGTAVRDGWAFELSPSINVSREKTYAYLNNAKIDSANAGSVTVDAKSVTDIVNVGGELSLAKNAAIGAAASWTVINNDTQAVLGSSVNNAGKVNVTASGSQTVTGVAGGLAASTDGVTGAGSLGVLSITGNVLAKVGQNAEIKNIAKEINVDATNAVDAVYVTGSAALANASSAAGAANTDVLTDINVTAEIGENAKLTGSSVAVNANKKEEIKNMAFAGSAGFGYSLNGAVTTSNLKGNAKVDLGKSSHVEGLKVDLSALNNAKIVDVAAGIQYGVNLAFGVGVDVANIKGNTGIYLADSAKVIATGKDGIGAHAESKRNVSSIVAGADASQNPAIGVSVSMVDLNGATEVVLADSASMQSLGTLAISAVNTRDITQVAGRLDLGGASGIGAGASSFNDEATTSVKTAESSKLIAGSEGKREFYTGKIITPDDGDAYLEKTEQNGLMVAAISLSDIDAVACNVQGGVSGAIGVGVVDYTDASSVKTDIMGDIVSNGDIKVIALNDSYDKPIGGTAEVSGGLSIGAAVSAVSLKRSVQATLGGTVSAKKDISVQALNNSKFLGVVGGAAIGQVGGVGSVSVLSDTSETNSALFGAVSADGNIELISKITADTKAYTGSFAAGLYGTGGAAVLVQNRNTKTNAVVSEGAVIKSKDFKVAALADDTNSSKVGSLAAAGYVAGTASVNVASANSVTRASVLSNAAITATGEAVVIAQSIRDYSEGAGELNAAAGTLGAAVNVLYINDTTDVLIGAGSNLTAAKAKVYADAQRNTDMTAVGLGGGLLNVQGSVNVLRIGSSLSASDSLKKGLGSASDLIKQVGDTANANATLKEGSTEAANQAINARNTRKPAAGYENTVKMFNDDEYKKLGVEDITSVLIGEGAEINAEDKVDILGSTKLDMGLSAGGYALSIAGVDMSMSDAVNNSNTLVRQNGNINAKGDISVKAKDIVGTENSKGVVAAQGDRVSGGHFGGILAEADNNANAVVSLSGAMTSEQGNITTYALETAYINAVARDFNIAGVDAGFSDAVIKEYGSARVIYKNAVVNALNGMLSNAADCETGLDVFARFTSIGAVAAKAAEATIDICTLAQLDISGSTLYGKVANLNTADTLHHDTVEANQGSTTLAHAGGTAAYEKFWSEASIKVKDSTLKSDGKVYVATLPKIEQTNVKADNYVVNFGSVGAAEAKIYGRAAHENSLAAPNSATDRYILNSLILVENSNLESAQEVVDITTNSAAKADVKVKADVTEAIGIMDVMGISRGTVNSKVDIKELNIRAREAWIEAYSGYHDIAVDNVALNSFGAQSDTDAESILSLNINCDILAQKLVINADESVFIEARVDDQKTSSSVYARTRALIPTGDVQADNRRVYTATIDIGSTDPADFTTPEMLIYTSAVDGKNNDIVATKGVDDATYRTTYHATEPEQRESTGNVIATLHARSSSFVIDENGDILYKPNGVEWTKDKENKTITITKFSPNNDECYQVIADDGLTGTITIDNDSGDGFIDNYSDYLVRFDNVEVDISKIGNTVYHTCTNKSVLDSLLNTERDQLVVIGETRNNHALTINSKKEGGGVQFKNTAILNAGLVLNKGNVVTDNASDYVKTNWIHLNDVDAVGSEGKELYVQLSKMTSEVYAAANGDINLRLGSSEKPDVSEPGESDKWKWLTVEIKGIESRTGSVNLSLGEKDKEENDQPEMLRMDQEYKIASVNAYKDLTLKTLANNVLIMGLLHENYTEKLALTAQTGKADIQLNRLYTQAVDIYAHTDLNLEVSGKVRDLNIANGEQSASKAHIKLHDLWLNGFYNHKEAAAGIYHQYNGDDVVELEFGSVREYAPPIVYVNRGNDPKFRVIYDDGTAGNTLCIIDTTAASVESVQVKKDNAFKIVEDTTVPYYEALDQMWLDNGRYPENDAKWCNYNCDSSTLWLLGGSIGSADAPMDVEFIDCEKLDLTVKAAKNSVNLKASVKPGTDSDSTVNFKEITAGAGDIAGDINVEFEGAKNGKFTIGNFTGKNIALLAEDDTKVEGSDVVLTSKAGIIDVDLNLKADSLTVSGMKSTDLELTDGVKKLNVNTDEGTAALVTVVSRDGHSLPADIAASLVNSDDRLDVTLNGNGKEGVSLKTTVAIDEKTKGLTDLHLAGDVDTAYVKGNTENLAIILEKDDATYNLTDGELATGTNNIVLENIGTKDKALAVEAAAKNAKIIAQSASEEEGKGDINLSVSATNEEAGIIELAEITSANGSVKLAMQDPENEDTEYVIGYVSGKDITVHADDSVNVSGAETETEEGVRETATVLHSNGGKIDFNADLTASELTVSGMSEADLKVTGNTESLNVETAKGTDAAVAVESRNNIDLPAIINAKLVNENDTLDVLMNGSDDNAMDTDINVSEDSNGTVNLHMAGSKDTANVDVKGNGSKVNTSLEKENGKLSISEDTTKDDVNNIVINRIGTVADPMNVTVAAANGTVEADAKEIDINLAVESVSEIAGKVKVTAVNTVNGNVNLLLKDPANADTEYVLASLSGIDVTAIAEENAKTSGQSVVVNSLDGKVVLDLALWADDLTVNGMASADLALNLDTTRLIVQSTSGTTADVDLRSRDGITLPAYITTNLVNDTDTMDVILNGTTDKTMCTTITAVEGSKNSLTLHMAGDNDVVFVQGEPVLVTAILEKEDGTLNISDDIGDASVNNVINENIGNADEPMKVEVAAENGKVTANAHGDINVTVESTSETAGKVDLTEINSESGDVQLVIRDAANADTEYILKDISGKDVTVISGEDAKVTGDKVTVTSNGGTVELEVDLTANDLTVKGMAKADLELTDNLKQLTLESTEGTDAAVSVESRDGESLPENILSKLVNTGDTLDVTLNGTNDKAMSTTVTNAEGSKGSLTLHIDGSKDTATVTGEAVKTTAIIEKEGAALNLSDDAAKEGTNNVIIDSVGTDAEPMHVDVAVTDATVTANTNGSINLSVESTTEAAGKVNVSEVNSANGDTVLTLEDPANADTAYVLTTVSGKDITVNANEETNVNGDRVLLDSNAGTIELNADLKANELTVRGMEKTDLRLDEDVKKLVVSSGKDTDTTVTVVSRDGSTLPESVITDLVNVDDILKIRIEGTEEKPIELNVTGTEQNVGKTELTMNGENDTVNVNTVSNLKVVLEAGILKITDTADEQTDVINSVIMDTVGSKEQPVEIVSKNKDTDIIAEADGDLYIKVGIETEGSDEHKVELSTVTSENGTASVVVTKPVRTDETEEDNELNYEYHLDAIEGKNVELITEGATVTGQKVVLNSTDPKNGTITADADVKTDKLTVSNMASADLKLTDSAKELLLTNTKGMHTEATVGGKDGSIVGHITTSLKNKGDKLNVVMSGNETAAMKTVIRQKKNRADFTVRFTGDKDKVKIYGKSKVTVYLKDNTDPTKYIRFNGMGIRRYKFTIANILTLIGKPIKTYSTEMPLVIFKLEDITQITDLKFEEETAFAQAIDVEDGLTVIDPDEVIITDNSRMAELNLDVIDIRMTDKLHVILDLKALLNKGMTDDITILYSEGVMTVLNRDDVILVFELGTLLDDTQDITTIVYDGDMLSVLDGEDTFCEAEVPDHAEVCYTADGLIVDVLKVKMAI